MAKPNNLALAFAASSFGLQIAGALLLGLWADNRFKTAPYLGLVGLVAGFVSGGLVLSRLVKSWKRDDTSS